MYVHLYLCDIHYREVVSSALAKEVSRIYVDNYTLHLQVKVRVYTIVGYPNSCTHGFHCSEEERAGVSESGW